MQAAAFGSGLPDDAAANAALAGNTNVAVDFDVGGTSTLLGYGVLGGAYASDGSGAAQTYSMSLDFDLDMSLIADPQDLLVGFLDPELPGSGFDFLDFRIELEGLNVFSQVFSDSGLALAFFDDNTLDLGDWTNGLAVWFRPGGTGGHCATPQAKICSQPAGKLNGSHYYLAVVRVDTR